MHLEALTSLSRYLCSFLGAKGRCCVEVSIGCRECQYLFSVVVCKKYVGVKNYYGCGELTNWGNQLGLGRYPVLCDEGMLHLIKVIGEATVPYQNMHFSGKCLLGQGIKYHGIFKPNNNRYGG